jgi:hypothetical protein
MDSRGHGSASNSPSDSDQELRWAEALSGLGANDTAQNLPLDCERCQRAFWDNTALQNTILSEHSPMSLKTENCGGEFQPFGRQGTEGGGHGHFGGYGEGIKRKDWCRHDGL